MEEIWKTIQQPHDRYEISSLGKVRSNVGLKPIIMKPFIRLNGYLAIKLRANEVNSHFPIHRLIAIAFVPNPENKKFVNHKDGNKLNNQIENLEWCTSSENNIHAIKTGLRPKAVHKTNGESSLAKRVRCECIHTKTQMEFDSITEANTYFGLKKNNSLFTQALKGKLKTAKKHTWTYITEK